MEGQVREVEADLEIEVEQSGWAVPETQVEVTELETRAELMTTTEDLAELETTMVEQKTITVEQTGPKIPTVE